MDKEAKRKTLLEYARELNQRWTDDGEKIVTRVVDGGHGHYFVERIKRKDIRKLTDKIK